MEHHFNGRFRLWTVLLWIVHVQAQPVVAAGDFATLPTPSIVATTTNTPSYRQSVCELNMYTTNSTAQLKDALSGFTLQPILTVSKFFNYSEANGIDEDHPGLVVQILDELARRANFTWRYSFAVSYGPDQNTTWTQMLSSYTKLFDVSVDYWDRSSERLNKGIAFMDPWFNGNMILIEKIVAPSDKDKVNYTNFLKPFAPSVWFTTLATILVSAFILISFWNI